MLLIRSSGLGIEHCKRNTKISEILQPGSFEQSWRFPELTLNEAGSSSRPSNAAERGAVLARAFAEGAAVWKRLPIAVTHAKRWLITGTGPGTIWDDEGRPGNGEMVSVVKKDNKSVKL